MLRHYFFTISSGGEKGRHVGRTPYLLREGAMGIGRRRGRWAKNIPINLDPLFMETQFSSVPPSNSLSSQCWILEGFFELMWHPSRVLNLTHGLFGPEGPTLNDLADPAGVG